MKDRFKFRVWENTRNCYLKDEKTAIVGDGDLIYGDMITNAMQLAYGKDNPNIIVEQSTGLKDKNGNLIYEGDVIQFTHNRGYFTNKGDIRVIEFSAFRFCGFGWRSRPENNVEFALTESAAKKCVVIGNIHEQAEQKDVK